MHYKDRSLAPIGVFDSGAGGLTILSALRQELPHEHYVYFGDTSHCPYGTRSDAEIIELTLQACHFLVEQGVKLIDIACNTASQAALSSLRSVYSLPFVGVVPAVKPAARITKRGRIGVAATSRASQASYLRHLIDEFAAGIEVYAVGCPTLVTLVERGDLEGPVVEADCARSCSRSWLKTSMSWCLAARTFRRCVPLSSASRAKAYRSSIAAGLLLVAPAPSWKPRGLSIPQSTNPRRRSNYRCFAAAIPPHSA